MSTDISGQYPSTSYVNDLCSLAANIAATPDYTSLPPSSTAFFGDSYIPPSPPLSPPHTSVNGMLSHMSMICAH
jgi:hypothetical protein